MPAIVSKEVFQKVKEMMEMRKKAPGADKAKELYLLSGLIYCGHCGAAMQGNRRNFTYKPNYSSYRCSCRHNKNQCDNKEVRKEYIEEYVLSELERNILNDKAIPILVKKVNEHLKEKVENDRTEMADVEQELAGVKKQIDNIVTAITNGFGQDEFKVKMEELEGRKVQLESKLREHECKNQAASITEEQVKQLFSMFKEFVTTRNLPECKKFISDYVKKVIVYNDHVEVEFNVVFSFLGDYGNFRMVKSISKRKLFEYRKFIA